MNHFHSSEAFALESGAVLPGVRLGYHTYGRLSERGDNAIWICHALTASSNVEEWWPSMVGAGRVFDTERYFVVCANILGSCYGSTGPLSEDPHSGSPYYHTFPLVTIRDMARAHGLLRRHLGIRKIHLLVGGSMGGYQALEWAVEEPDLIEGLVLLATSARESAWGIAIHSAQRLAIEADATWKDPSPQGGSLGLKTARAIGMITYRNYHTYKATQSDEDQSKLEGFKAASYIEHQGNKLVKRFNAYSYYALTKSMDTHHLGRGRGGVVEEVLKGIRQRTLVVSIRGDLLCPPEEQHRLAAHIPGAHLVEVDSLYGHDGFLVERDTIAKHVWAWLAGTEARIANTG
jgi:homoserine O-acetyltransferase/O-succinyltransferase